MEPKLPAPDFNPERPSPSYGKSGERESQLTPETEVGQGNERFESRAAAPPVILPPISPSQVVSAPIPTSSPQSSSVTDDDGMPLVANDDDLIEKEWVDKAKKIIVETKEDPYRREHEVGKLQADYLRKRYGKELGASS
jgi:hypothetical protein